MPLSDWLRQVRTRLHQFFFGKVEYLRYWLFLKDILALALTTFGGPQTHLAFFFEKLVQKREYLTEKDLMELYALCQILPGPSTTQLLTAVGYKKGGLVLAFSTLFVWSLPAFLMMTAFGIFINALNTYEISLHFTRFMKPIAIGIMAYAAWRISTRVIQTKTAWVIFFVSIGLCLYYPNPYSFPVILLLGGLLSTYKMESQEKKEKTAWHFEWRYAFWYSFIFAGTAVLANLLQYKPLLLFENFYRNGSLIFGGGQVLIPALYNEFVSFKQQLSADEFLTGYAFGQVLPGPVFSFSAYIGSLSMRASLSESIIGAIIATTGVYLPGTLLILFVMQFWEQLKEYRIVRASLEGISAASAGMISAGSFILSQSLSLDFQTVGIIAGTFLVLRFTKIPISAVVILGLLIGLV